MGIDKVLIVDHDPAFLEKMHKGLGKFGQFEVLTAQDAQHAIAIMRQESISILVTCLNMPHMDGLELLATVTKDFPNILSIVATSLPYEPMEKYAQGDSVYSFLNKPFDHIRLHEEIIKMLDYRDELRFRPGIYLSSILPLINLMQKTCLVEVMAGRNQKGYFYFKDGVICDVRCGEKTDSEALKDMLNWGPVRYWFKSLPDDPAVEEFHDELTSLFKDSELFGKL